MTTFWMHEDADDYACFGADTPEEAVRVWLLTGAGTSEHDPDANDDCIQDRVELFSHRVVKYAWKIVETPQQLEELRESADVDDDWLDTLRVGSSYYTSVASVRCQAEISLIITTVETTRGRPFSTQAPS